ncbi:MAG: alcohol dehydrogenase catalytic domain-containing protein, partial [Nitrospirae bacterium]|nr:alcohol dehydrogenase catalytic domain-containing protein [Nitrospirota bacterium]
MKALVKTRPEPGLWMEEVPVPAAGTNEVLIKVFKTGICGTDLHIYRWDDWAERNVHPPRVVGREFVGEVVEIGPGAKGYAVGDRVTG